MLSLQACTELALCSTNARPGRFLFACALKLKAFPGQPASPQAISPDPHWTYYHHITSVGARGGCRWRT